MPKKYSFPELGCSSCEHLQRVGGVLCETRYCGGFPKKKKPRRFRSSNPKYKAPKWCPRRLPTPVCRIYSFADEQSRSIEILSEHDIGLGEVVEIDDGLKPYYFYYLNWSNVVPVSYYNLNGIQKGD